MWGFLVKIKQLLLLIFLATTMNYAFAYDVYIYSGVIRFAGNDESANDSGCKVGDVDGVFGASYHPYTDSGSAYTGAGYDQDWEKVNIITIYDQSRVDSWTSRNPTFKTAVGDLNNQDSNVKKATITPWISWTAQPEDTDSPTRVIVTTPESTLNSVSNTTYQLTVEGVVRNPLGWMGDGCYMNFTFTGYLQPSYLEQQQ